MPSSPWDIFCCVVDNYGDIGVSWRLARQLAAEHDVRVRLWVDDLDSFAMLDARIDPLQPMQNVAGVQVRHWTPAAIADVQPGAVVIEAFGCKLQDAFEQRMATNDPRPVWINLEYLSAETWVDSHHRMPSPHPRLPLTRHFFYPGFTPATGGLLRERDLLRTRDAFVQDAAAHRAFWHRFGFTPAADALKVSLFAYPNAAIASLLDTWAAGPQPVFCAIPASRVLPDVAHWTGQALAPRTTLQRGALQIAVLPFLHIDDYDRLLWACDVNFVRGEDSFVRAQWAAKPLVWHIYPQTEDTHMVKLAAFADRYQPGAALGAFWQAWNRGQDCGVAWRALAANLPVLQQHARAWCADLAQAPDLTRQLAEFRQSLLK